VGRELQGVDTRVDSMPLVNESKNNILISLIIKSERWKRADALATHERIKSKPHTKRLDLWVSTKKLKYFSKRKEE
jgi:hypothetical protein